MPLNLSIARPQHELRPRITVVGVGGAGGNAVNNMIRLDLTGVDFMVANTDAQALGLSLADSRIQLGLNLTAGLGAGSKPEIGKGAAEEALAELVERLAGNHMVFITAGMGGGTGTGAAPVIARAAREQGILTVGVVTKPFHFEGTRRMRLAEEGIEELGKQVDTLIIIPNQNLFRIANEKTTFADAFNMADNVLYSGVRGVTDLMVKPGLINLDFADIRTVMSEMGKAMMGTGEAQGEKRSIMSAEAAISNPLLDDISMKGARGILINITGGNDMTLFEVDEAANRIRDEVDPDANIIFGATYDETMDGKMRVSVVATGIDAQLEAMQPVRHQPTIAAVGGVRVEAPAAARGPQMAPTYAAPQQAVASAPAAATMAASSASTMAAPMQQQPMQQPMTQGNAALAMQPAPVAPAPQPAAAPEPARVSVPHAGAAFIPPTPQMPGERTPAAPTVAAPLPAASAGAQRKPGRFNSLFGRVTGSRQASLDVEAPQAAAPTMPQQQRPAPVAAPAPQASERAPVSRSEDDMLDIPAFLRRQAN